jgi:hypothetical protein
MILKVDCTHTEPELQKNVSCKLISDIDDYEDKIAAVYECPICKRQIVISMERSY